MSLRTYHAERLREAGFELSSKSRSGCCSPEEATRSLQGAPKQAAALPCSFPAASIRREGGRLPLARGDWIRCRGQQSGLYDFPCGEQHKLPACTVKWLGPVRGPPATCKTAAPPRWLPQLGKREAAQSKPSLCQAVSGRPSPRADHQVQDHVRAPLRRAFCSRESYTELEGERHIFWNPLQTRSRPRFGQDLAWSPPGKSTRGALNFRMESV